MSYHGLLGNFSNHRRDWRSLENALLPATAAPGAVENPVALLEESRDGISPECRPSERGLGTALGHSAGGSHGHVLDGTMPPHGSHSSSCHGCSLHWLWPAASNTPLHSPTGHAFQQFQALSELHSTLLRCSPLLSSRQCQCPSQQAAPSSSSSLGAQAASRAEVAADSIRGSSLLYCCLAFHRRLSFVAGLIRTLYSPSSFRGPPLGFSSCFCDGGMRASERAGRGKHGPVSRRDRRTGGRRSCFGNPGSALWEAQDQTYRISIHIHGSAGAGNAESATERAMSRAIFNVRLTCPRWEA